MASGSNFSVSALAIYTPASLASPQGLPAFWTREQTGEEACAWLLFRHMARPRSRLLSTEAVDAALRFAGMLGHDAAEQ